MEGLHQSVRGFAPPNGYSPFHNKPCYSCLLISPAKLSAIRVSVRSALHEMETGGVDSDGREFKNADEMWTEEVGDNQKKTDWYRNGVSYWEVRTLFIPLQNPCLSFFCLIHL